MNALRSFGLMEPSPLLSSSVNACFSCRTFSSGIASAPSGTTSDADMARSAPNNQQFGSLEGMEVDGTVAKRLNETRLHCGH